MTAISRSIVCAASGSGRNITQNFTNNDTVTVTVTGFSNQTAGGVSGSNGTAGEQNTPVTITGQDSSGNVALSANGATFVVNPAANGSYTVSVFSGKVGQSNFRSGSMSGTVSGFVVDTTPNQFTFSDPFNIAGGSIVTKRIQVSGFNTTTTASVSGGGGTTVVQNGGSVSNNTTFTTANKSINSGQYLFLRHTASTTPGATVSSTVSIGGVSDTMTTTTYTAASAGNAALTGQPAAPGNNAYGIKVFGPNGSTEVFSSNLRASNLQVSGTFSLSGSQTATFACSAANDTSKVIIVVSSAVQGHQNFLTLSKATNSYTIGLTGSGSANVTGVTYAIRTK